MFYIIEQGARIQTPLESLLRHKTVNALDKTAAIGAISDNQTLTRDKPSPKSSDSPYQGAAKRANSQPRTPAIYAEQIMTHPVIATTANQSLSLCHQYFEREKFHHLPIVSEQKILSGIITDRDLMRFILNNPRLDLNLTTIQRVMQNKVITASTNTTIRSIADVMCKQGFSAMPITNDSNQLIGIVSRTDILRTLVNESHLEMWV